jgi:hypothetical protein
MLAGMTVFFFLASFIQLFYLHSRISDPPRLDPQQLAVDIPKDAAPADRMALQRLRLATNLESNTVARRYHQANVLLMSRVWANYLGFVTGMTLALVGATFVLGQLKTSATELDFSAVSVQSTLRSASPGITLTVLGVILMIATIVTHYEIQTSDIPTYFSKESLGGTVGQPDIKLTAPAH